MIDINETLDELVAARRGYKYMSSDGVSPYQEHKYDLSCHDIIETRLDGDRNNECGAGWNLATVRWIMDNCLRIEGNIVEFSIPPDAEICVPKESDGKFRTNRVAVVSVNPVVDVFPVLRGLRERLRSYVPVNPITATVLPDVALVGRGVVSVKDSIRIRGSVEASVGMGASVFRFLMASIGGSVWSSVWSSVRTWASVWTSVGMWDSLWYSLWSYSSVCGYCAIVNFLSLDYRHPVFDLIDLGVMVIPHDDNYLVFGKDGVLLGRVAKND